jgi:hypothetical protein
MLFGPKEAFMFAYPRRLALGIASLAALLLSLGLVALSATPAVATVCPSLSFNGTTISNCSETFNITEPSPGSYNVTATYNISNGSPYLNSGYDISGNVLVGVTNNTGSTVYDLALTSFSAGPPIFNFNAFNASERLSNTSLASFIGACTGATGDEGVIIVGTNGGGTPVSTGQCVVFNIATTSNGDVIFNSGLPNGDTAIFGLVSNAATVCVTNQAGACIPTTASEPAAIGIFLTGLLGFGILRRRWLARAASPRRPRPKRQSRQIQPTGWISRLLATA